MGYNKIVVGGVTKLSLENDTVTADKLLSGYTAHDKAGDEIEGTCTFDADTKDADITPGDVVAGKIGYKNGAKVVGDIPVKGGVTLELTERDTPVVIPYGVHDGSGTVGLSAADKTDLIAKNIREGVDILGVMGTMSGTEGVKAQQKTVTPTMAVQNVVPDSEFTHLSKVVVNAIPVVETPNPAGGTTLTIG